MNYFTRLFKKRPKATVECPRCLGKGHVDADDIKRLGNELVWRPGKCAYCNGAGKIPTDMDSKLPANAGYLSTNRSKAERKRLLRGNPAALERMRRFDANIVRVTEEIKKLHFVRKLDVEWIAELYLGSDFEAKTESNIKKKKEMIAFINKVIAQGK